jgi:hypothetical protein
MDSKESSQILQVLGEIRGELKGINAMIAANNTSVNQRLEDMQKSNDQRLDGIEARVEHVEAEQKAIIWKVAGWSSLGGAIVTAGVELIKHVGK